jgi:putative membrane protein
MTNPLPEHQKTSEHLAAERTFLAWVRTGIAVISLGFVVAKFGVWLHELAARLDPQMQMHSTGMSLPMGVGMMAFGGVLTVLAAWHCHVVYRSIERGEVGPNRGLVITVTAGVALLAAVLIVYMLATAESL